MQSLVGSAYTDELDGFIILPNALLDSPEYKGLSPSARNWVDLAYRRSHSIEADRLVFTFANVRDYFTKSHFYELRNEAIRAGLIIETEPSRKPQQGVKPEAARYSLRYVHSPAGRTIQEHSIVLPSGR